MPSPLSSLTRQTTVRSEVKEHVRRFLPRKVKAHSVLAGPLRGSKIFASWHDYPGAILGTTERNLLRWFQANVRTGETWLDVGAHYGYTAIALSRLVGPQGRVFAFEPVKSTAAFLARTRTANALEQLTVVPIALSDRPHRSTLRVPSIRGMADSTIASGETWETISAISLDAFWSKLAGSVPRIHGVKIDVQGMELLVLRGMRQLLTRWLPKLIVEFHRGVNRESVIDLLLSAGYSKSYRAIHSESPELADDCSYLFEPETSACAFSSIRSIIAQS
jgi:FkbM family methyltransferase